MKPFEWCFCGGSSVRGSNTERGHRITLEIPDEKYKDIKKYAEDIGLTVGEFIVDAVEERLEGIEAIDKMSLPC